MTVQTDITRNLGFNSSYEWLRLPEKPNLVRCSECALCPRYRI